MNKDFYNWLGKQKYRYYTGDPLNDDTKRDWIIDGVISSYRSSHKIWSWDEILRIKL